MKKSELYQIVVLIAPIIFVFFTIKISVFFTIIANLAMFATILILPICREYENLFLFVLSFFINSPLNLRILLTLIKDLNFSEVYPSFIMIFAYIFAFFIMQSIEEIFLGCLMKIIRPNQYRFDEDEEEEDYL